jgi:hypothetical protein
MENKIKVLEVIENEDGTASVKLDLDPELYAKIFEYGFVELIKKGIKVDGE